MTMHFEAHMEIANQVGVLPALRRAGTDVVLIHGERQLRADECLDTVYRMARALTDAGVGPGSVLGLLSLNLPEGYLAQLAGRLLGCRYTPLHPLGSLDDHEYVIDDAEIDVLVYDPRYFTGRVAELLERGAIKQLMSLGPSEVGDDLLDLAAPHSAEPLTPAAVKGGDVCTVYYTGGTTGKPKGVAHTWFGTWYTEALSVGNRAEPGPPPRMLITTPISHAGGTALGPTIMRGGSVVLADGFEPTRYLELVQRWGVTSAFLVPTMIYVLLDTLSDREIDVSTLTEVVYGAAPMSPTRLAEAIARFGPIFQQGYGQTEAGVGILALRKTDHDPARPDRLASAGRPTIGVVAAVLREDLSECPPGEVGELCLRGPMLMKGYWKNDELTAHALRGGWLHTDDLAVADADGYLTLVDRRKDMIISGGFNVYPSEVENAISELPDVSACAVIGVPDEKWGEAVKAFVVVADGAALTAEQVIAHVKQRKGSVNAPKSVAFVDALPLTAVGKLDKKALRQRELAAPGTTE